MKSPTPVEFGTYVEFRILVEALQEHVRGGGLLPLKFDVIWRKIISWHLVEFAPSFANSTVLSLKTSYSSFYDATYLFPPFLLHTPSIFAP